MSDNNMDRIRHAMWRDAWGSMSHREQECLKHWFHVGKPDGIYLDRKTLAATYGISATHLRRIVLRAAKKFDVARVIALVTNDEVA